MNIRTPCFPKLEGRLTQTKRLVVCVSYSFKICTDSSTVWTNPSILPSFSFKPRNLSPNMFHKLGGTECLHLYGNRKEYVFRSFCIYLYHQVEVNKYSWTSFCCIETSAFRLRAQRRKSLPAETADRNACTRHPMCHRRHALCHGHVGPLTANI